MLSAKDKFSIAITVLATALLIAVLSFSVMLAAFTQTKQATTTIEFADGVILKVSGINSNNVWTINSNSTTTTVVAPFSFDAINVTVTQGAGTASDSLNVYVRVFAVVYSSSTKGLAEFTQTTTTLTSSEDTKFKSISATNKKYIALTHTFSADKDNATILNSYTPFADLASTTAGETVNGYVLVYATNNVPKAGWDSVTGYTTAVNGLF